MVEGIVGVRLVKDVNKAIDDGINIEDGLPVLPENVEAYLALKIYVGMIDAGLTCYLGRSVGVMVGNFEHKQIGCTLPEAGVGCDGYVEESEIIGIGKINRGDLASVEFGHILRVVVERVAHVGEREYE